MQYAPEYSSPVSQLYQESLQQWMMVEDLKLWILCLMSSILKADNKNNNNLKKKDQLYLIALED